MSVSARAAIDMPMQGESGRAWRGGHAGLRSVIAADHGSADRPTVDQHRIDPKAGACDGAHSLRTDGSGPLPGPSVAFPA